MTASIRLCIIQLFGSVCECISLWRTAVKECNVALYGCGTVGAGVADILLGRRGALSERIGERIRLHYVVDKRLKQIAAEVPFPAYTKLTDDLEAPVRDPDVDVVIELFGGIAAARSVIEKALKAGKDVVTANKALLAAHGGVLFRLARQNERSIAFEASVCGGIPIISALRNALVADRIESIYGIVNGTCNYILTQMSESGLPYDHALAEAQEKGYAEADPALDVEGDDAAHKLAILAHLAFGLEVTADDIAREGISNVEPEDLRYARSLGYTLKLLATGIRHDNALELRVHPCLLRHGHPLASVGGACNAVCIHGDLVGEVVLTGLGAGRWPTASAVVADVCRVALGTYRTDFAEMSQFDEVLRAVVKPLAELKMRYYFRLSCLDRPGVLAQTAGILGRHGISIASCIQQNQAPPGEEHVPVVFMTHEAREGSLRDALQEINRLDCIDGSKTRMLRVQDI